VQYTPAVSVPIGIRDVDFGEQRTRARLQCVGRFAPPCPGNVRSGIFRNAHDGIKPRGPTRMRSPAGQTPGARITLLCMMVNMNVPVCRIGVHQVSHVDIALGDDAFRMGLRRADRPFADIKHVQLRLLRRHIGLGQRRVRPPARSA